MKEILRFEWNYQIRKPVIWIFFFLLFALTILIYAAMGGMMGKIYTSPPNTSGKVWLNSPYVVMSFMASMTVLGTILIPAIFGTAALRDFRHGAHPISLSLPIKKYEYFFGHFVGAILVALLIFTAIPLAILISSWLPNMDAERFGPIRLWGLFAPYLLIILPNLFFIGAFFYALAITSRRMVLSYVGGILLFIAYAFAVSSVTVDNAFLASLTEPFASQAIISETQYWTPEEQSQRYVPWQGSIVWNRLLWIVLGIVVLGVSFSRFKMAYKEA